MANLNILYKVMNDYIQVLYVRVPTLKKNSNIY